MAGSSAALWPTETHSTSFKRSKPPLLTQLSSVQESRSTFKVSYLHSKYPHFNSVYKYGCRFRWTYLYIGFRLEVWRCHTYGEQVLLSSFCCPKMILNSHIFFIMHRTFTFRKFLFPQAPPVFLPGLPRIAAENSNEAEFSPTLCHLSQNDRFVTKNITLYYKVWSPKKTLIGIVKVWIYVPCPRQ